LNEWLGTTRCSRIAAVGAKRSSRKDCAPVSPPERCGYADELVDSISLGYLYVLPLGVGAIFLRKEVSYGLIAICILLHDYQLASADVSPGDMVLLYTDGVTEAENKFGEEFGIERLSEVLRRGSSLSAEDLMDDIYNAAADFCGNEFNDDVTIVVIKCDFNGSPALPSRPPSPRQKPRVPSAPACGRCVRPESHACLEKRISQAVNMLTSLQFTGPLPSHHGRITFSSRP